MKWNATFISTLNMHDENAIYNLLIHEPFALYIIIHVANSL